VNAPTNCTISSYTVLQNGTSIETPTGTSFAVTGLSASTAYSFTVEATDAHGTSGPSSSVDVTTLANSCAIKPSAPTGLAASGTTSSGTSLSWTADTAPANCTISTYSVLQNGTSIGTPTGTSFAVSGLAASTSYSFSIEATDAAGTSTASSPLNVTTLANGGGPCATAWSATAAYTQGMTASVGRRKLRRQFLDAKPKFGDQQRRGWHWRTLDRNWTLFDLLVRTGDSDWIGGFGHDQLQHESELVGSSPPRRMQCQYKVLQGGISIATPPTTSDAVTGLTPSTTYGFTVEATDAADTSAASSPVNVTTQASSCTTKPSAPTGLAASSTTDSSTNMSWNAVTPPTGCSISYSITGGPSTLTTASTSDTEGGLTPSTSYTFSVVATNFAGPSPASSVTVTTSKLTNLVMAGWFEEWGTYYANANVADLQNNGVANVLTHVLYAFADPVVNGSNINCALADTYADYQKAVPQVPGAPPRGCSVARELRRTGATETAPSQSEVLISLGGYSPTNLWNTNFATASSTAAGRTAFVSSGINMFLKGNIASGVSTGTLFDGFNIDWEFPTATDTNNFTALLTEFRNEMTALTATTGKTYQLTADLAAGASNAQNPGGYDTINISAVAAQLDFMTVDGYNYAGDWSNATNDASPLYDETANPLYGTGLTIDATVQYYLSHGTPAGQIHRGLPALWCGLGGRSDVGQQRHVSERHRD
jgi:chitinase